MSGRGWGVEGAVKQKTRKEENSQHLTNLRESNYLKNQSKLISDVREVNKKKTKTENIQQTTKRTKTKKIRKVLKKQQEEVLFCLQGGLLYSKLPFVGHSFANSLNISYRYNMCDGDNPGKKIPGGPP